MGATWILGGVKKQNITPQSKQMSLLLGHQFMIGARSCKQ